MLEIKKISKYFDKRKAVNEISFSIERGETVGLVGESGSGKSTLAKIILRLLIPSSGEVLFENENIANIQDIQTFRKSVQMIFQDPASSLNPRMTIKEILKEPFLIHNMKPEIDKLLEMVKLDSSSLNRFPHEFSGGQKQRIGIARALALSPKLIVCDEPISSLDVSIQAQIINLLKDLQDTFKISYLFIAHDLATVKCIASKVAVMYRGSLVEIGKTEDIYEKPAHPYTQMLLNSSKKRSIR